MPARHFILLLALAATLLVYWAYAQLQPTYTYAQLDPRFDAHQYARAYHYFKGQSSQYIVSFPFNARILSPWLAAQLPFNEAEKAFRWLNGFFVLLTVGFLVFTWQKLHIRNSLVFVGLFVVLFHWKSIVRMYLPDPISADVMGYFFGAVWLFWVLFKNQPTTVNYLVLSAIGVFAALQKESFTVVAGVTWLFFVIKKQNSNLFLIPFVVAVVAHFWADWAFAAAQTDWRNNSAITVLRGVKRYAENPELLLRLPVSWLLSPSLLTVGGGILLIQPATHGPQLTTQYLRLMTITWLILSIVGGGDTTRIFVNGLPLVLTYLLVELNQKPRWVAYFLGITSLPLLRLFELEPDLGLHPEQAPRWCVECWTLAESWPYLAYFGVVLTVYYYFARRFAAVESGKPNEI